MTSRIIEVAAAYIQHNERLVRRYGSSLWTNVLKSVSAFQMYRQYCQRQVQGIRVIDFLLCDRAFPRSIAFCVDSARSSCAALPRGRLRVPHWMTWTGCCSRYPPSRSRLLTLRP